MSSKRIAAYLRVSTADQNCETQRRELEAYLQARGWNEIIWYQDDGFSGRNTKRPAFQKLMNDARSRKVDVVIVYKLDRMARSLRDLILTLDELGSLGIAFIAVKDHIDLSTPTGRLMMHLLGAFSAFEADLIKERCRAGIANAKAQGKRFGRPCTIDANRARQLRSEGKSLAQIAKALGSTRSGVSKVLRRYSLSAA